MKLSLTIQTPEVKTGVPVALLMGGLEEKLRKAAQMYADGVELMTTFPEQLDRARIYTDMEKYGLKAAAISSGAIAYCLGLTLLHADPNKAEAAKERLYKLIDFAAEMKAPIVTIGSFRGRLASLPGKDGRQIIRETLTSACEYAYSYSIRLAVEPLNRYESDFILNAKQGLEFVSEVNHPSIGVLLDTYHMNIEENSWTEPFEQLMREDKLYHIHIGDNNRLPPGRGLINFSKIVNTLEKLGYAGFLSAELLGKPDPDTAARETAQYMRPLIHPGE